MGKIIKQSERSAPVSEATQAELDLKANQSSISNIDNTSDANKPVSTAQQTALDLKANAADLSNVDNTSDADKPVSTATQTALDLKPDNANDIGLGNVDNTSDVDKPVSTAQQTALDLKEDSFSKNTAHNKNFGSGAGDVAEGNDARLSDSRTCNNGFDNVATSRTNLDVYSTTEVDNMVAGAYINRGAYNVGTNSPDLDTSPSGVKNGDAYTATGAPGQFFTEDLENGDVLIANQDNPTLLSHWTIVNKNLHDYLFTPKELDIDITAGGNFRVEDAAGYSALDRQINVRLISTVTVSLDVTVEFPAVSSTVVEINFKDVNGNGLIAPDKTLKLIPKAGSGDSVESSDGILVDEYDIDTDYESATFMSDFAITKWGAK